MTSPLDGLVRYVVLDALPDEFESEGHAYRRAIERSMNELEKRFYVAAVIGHVEVPGEPKPVQVHYVSSKEDR